MDQNIVPPAGSTVSPAPSNNTTSTVLSVGGSDSEKGQEKMQEAANKRSSICACACSTLYCVMREMGRRVKLCCCVHVYVAWISVMNQSSLPFYPHSPFSRFFLYMYLLRSSFSLLSPLLFASLLSPFSPLSPSPPLLFVSPLSLSSSSSPSPSLSSPPSAFSLLPSPLHVSFPSIPISHLSAKNLSDLSMPLMRKPSKHLEIYSEKRYE